MNERNVETVYTRDRSSGRIHARTRVNGQLMSDERCNLDDAGAYDVVTEAEAMAPDADRCAYDFPAIDNDEVEP